MLFDFSMDNSLVVLNGKSTSDIVGDFTFVSHTGASVIDYILTSLDFCTNNFIDFEVEPTLVSDHSQLIMKFKTHRMTSALNVDSCLMISIWRDGLAQSFREAVFDASLEVTSNPKSDIDDFQVQLGTLLYTCAMDTGLIYAKKQNSFNKGWNSWFDQDCRLAKNRLWRNRSKLQRCYSTRGYMEFSSARKSYRQLCKEKKHSYYKGIGQELINCRNSSTFWKIINRFRRKFSPLPNIPTEEWHRHFSELFSTACPNETSGIPLWPDLELPILDPIMDIDITLQEMTAMIKGLKVGKSPGIDLIRTEYLKNVPDNFLQLLLKLFNKVIQDRRCPKKWAEVLISPIYKNGDPLLPENYRGISLISIVSKLFTGILDARLQLWLDEFQILTEFQAGFRPGYGCLDHIFSLNAIVQSRLHKSGGRLFTVFIDLKKAFDSIPHNLLWHKLRGLGLSCRFIQTIQNYYSNATARIRTSKTITPTIDIGAGVLQGEVLSPKLFSLFINDIVKCLENLLPVDILGTNINILLYADDIVVFSDTPIDLQRKIVRITEYCKLNFLSPSLKKTEVLIFTKGPPIRRFSWYWGDVKLNVAKTYTYLGVPFSSSGLFFQASEYFISRSLTAINSSWKIFSAAKVAAIGVNIKIFKSLVLSVMSYASPIWCLRYLSQLERIFGVFARRLLSVTRNVPNYMLRLELGQPRLSTILIKQLMRYWVRILEMDNTRIPKICYLKLIQLSARQTGVKYNWVLQLRQIIDESGFSFLWESQDSALISRYIPRVVYTVVEQSFQRDFEHARSSAHFPMYRYISLHESIRPEAYLMNTDCEMPVIRVLAQLRLNYSSIFLSGKLYTIAPNTVCQVCNFLELEDWAHIFLRCPVYNYLRDRYLPNINLYYNNCYFYVAFFGYEKYRYSAIFGFLCNVLRYREIVQSI